MRRYSEAVKADVRRRMHPPHRQSVARISEELGIHVMTFYKWRKAWRLQGEVVPSSETPSVRKVDASPFQPRPTTRELNGSEMGKADVRRRIVRLLGRSWLGFPWSWPITFLGHSSRLRSPIHLHQIRLYPVMVLLLGNRRRHGGSLS